MYGSIVGIGSISFGPASGSSFFYRIVVIMQQVRIKGWPFPTSSESACIHVGIAKTASRKWKASPLDMKLRHEGLTDATKS